MNTITMQIVKKIEEIAIEQGHVKDEKIDTASLTNKYLEEFENQEVDKKQARKRYTATYNTFNNFFKPEKKWTNTTLEKLVKVLDITDIDMKAKKTY